MGYANACYLSYPHNAIIVDSKQDICSHVVAQWFRDGLWNKP